MYWQKRFNESNRDEDIEKKADREKIEEEKIKELQPILQIRYDKHYPWDKALKNGDIWLKRDEIRVDQCIKKKIIGVI